MPGMLRYMLILAIVVAYLIILAKQPTEYLHHTTQAQENIARTPPSSGSNTAPLYASAADLLNMTAASSAKLVKKLGSRHRPGRWRQINLWVGSSSILDGRAATEGLPFGSQVGQADLIADIFGRARGGFFVDLAANDPAFMSNSLMLETLYGWDGICIEANPRFVWDLARRSCKVAMAVASDSDKGSVRFAFRSDDPGLGGIVASGLDNANLQGRTELLTKLPTVRLDQILSQLEAPRDIWYLSLDVEGAEMLAMKGASSRFRFATMTVERPSPELQRTLSARSMLYVRLTSEFGDMLFVNSSLQGVERVLVRHRDLRRDEREYGYLPDAAYFSLPQRLANWQDSSGPRAPTQTKERNLERCAVRWAQELVKSQPSPGVAAAGKAEATKSQSTLHSFAVPEPLHSRGYMVLKQAFTPQQIAEMKQRAVAVLGAQEQGAIRQLPTTIGPPGTIKTGVIMRSLFNSPLNSAARSLMTSMERVARGSWQSWKGGTGHFEWAGHADLHANTTKGWHRDAPPEPEPWTALKGDRNPNELWLHRNFRVILYLEEHSQDNGALLVLPGSHANKSIEPPECRNASECQLDWARRLVNPAAVDATDPRVAVLQPAIGDALLIDHRVLHRGGDMGGGRPGPRMLLQYSFGEVGSAFLDSFKEWNAMCVRRERDQCPGAYDACVCYDEEISHRVCGQDGCGVCTKPAPPSRWPAQHGFAERIDLCGRLEPGASLFKGEFVASAQGAVVLLQNDGNLVVFPPGARPWGAVSFQSGTSGGSRSSSIARLDVSALELRLADSAGASVWSRNLTQLGHSSSSSPDLALASLIAAGTCGTCIATSTCSTPPLASDNLVSKGAATWSHAGGVQMPPPPFDQIGIGQRLPRVTHEQLLARRPPEPPYLASPPQQVELVPGRQLFVDDYLIETSNATRTFHSAVSIGPVLEPTARETVVQSDEFAYTSFTVKTVGSARPFSGGVWYDRLANRFVLFYRCAYVFSHQGRGCVAFSEDGHRWSRPPQNMLNCASATESFTVWLDDAEEDPSARWKALVKGAAPLGPMRLWVSADSLHWRPLSRSKAANNLSNTEEDHSLTGPATDRTTFFYNPFSRHWVYSLRENLCRGGHRHMRIATFKQVDTLSESKWPEWVSSYFQCRDSPHPDAPAPWVGADDRDCAGATACDLYALDATPYESLMVSQLAITFPRRVHGICKSTRVFVGFSRDGFHWTRSEGASAGSAERPPLIQPTHGLSYEQPIAGNFIVVGDALYIFHSGAKCRLCNHNPFPGRTGRTTENWPDSKDERKVQFCSGGDAVRDGPISPDNSSMTEMTGLAILRRDGFASLASPSATAPAVVTTRPLKITRSGELYLFVNVDASVGDLQVAVLDRRMRPLGKAKRRLSLDACASMKGVNTTRGPVSWHSPHTGAALTDIASARSAAEQQPRTVRLQFVLHGGAHLYSFWLSPSAYGQSFGFGSGPSFQGGRDGGSLP